MALLIAVLATSLLLGTAYLVVNRPAVVAPSLAGESLTDAAATAQVVDSAKQIVRVARLHGATGGSSFMSCANANEPPYQAAVYLSFALPQTNSVKYLSDVRAAMVAAGWTDAPAMSEHFGQKLTKDGVTSIFYRNAGDARFATMRLYGECRNLSDHRNDHPVWTEVTAQLR